MICWQERSKRLKVISRGNPLVGAGSWSVVEDMCTQPDEADKTSERKKSPLAPELVELLVAGQELS
jgi:hypothetical protein